MTPDEREVRALRAKALLADEVLNEALDALAAQCVEAWDATKLANATDRELAWLTRKATMRLRTYLQSIADDYQLKVHAAQAVNPLR